jgi:hypothetical protein
MRAMACIVLSDDGLFNANSSSKTPVSAVRLEAVSGFASSPVETRSEDTVGIP